MTMKKPSKEALLAAGSVLSASLEGDYPEDHKARVRSVLEYLEALANEEPIAGLNSSERTQLGFFANASVHHPEQMREFARIMLEESQAGSPVHYVAQAFLGSLEK